MIIFAMCETLDEIHDAQLAFVIAKMRKEKSEKQVICN
jgi:hypothetical protein